MDAEAEAAAKRRAAEEARAMSRRRVRGPGEEAFYERLNEARKSREDLGGTESRSRSRSRSLPSSAAASPLRRSTAKAKEKATDAPGALNDALNDAPDDAPDDAEDESVRAAVLRAREAARALAEAEAAVVTARTEAKKTEARVRSIGRAKSPARVKEKEKETVKETVDADSEKQSGRSATRVAPGVVSGSRSGATARGKAYAERVREMEHRKWERRRRRRRLVWPRRWLAFARIRLRTRRGRRRRSRSPARRAPTPSNATPRCTRAARARRAVTAAFHRYYDARKSGTTLVDTSFERELVSAANDMPAFRGLHPRHLARVFEAATLERHPAGSVVCREGDERGDCATRWWAANSRCFVVATAHIATDGSWRTILCGTLERGATAAQFPGARGKNLRGPSSRRRRPGPRGTRPSSARPTSPERRRRRARWARRAAPGRSRVASRRARRSARAPCFVPGGGARGDGDGALGRLAPRASKVEVRRGDGRRREDGGGANGGVFAHDRTVPGVESVGRGSSRVGDATGPRRRGARRRRRRRRRRVAGRLFIREGRARVFAKALVMVPTDPEAEESAERRGGELRVRSSVGSSVRWSVRSSASSPVSPGSPLRRASGTGRASARAAHLKTRDVPLGELVAPALFGEECLVPYVYPEDQGGGVGPGRHAFTVAADDGGRLTAMRLPPDAVDALPRNVARRLLQLAKSTNAASVEAREALSARSNAADSDTDANRARVAFGTSPPPPAPLVHPRRRFAARTVRRGRSSARRRRIGRGRGTHARSGRGWKTKTGEANPRATGDGGFGSGFEAYGRRRGVLGVDPTSNGESLARRRRRRVRRVPPRSSVARGTRIADADGTNARGGGGGGDARGDVGGASPSRGSRDDPVEVRGSGDGLRATEHPAQGSDDQESRGVGGEEQTPREVRGVFSA